MGIEFSSNSICQYFRKKTYFNKYFQDMCINVYKHINVYVYAFINVYLYIYIYRRTFPFLPYKAYETTVPTYQYMYSHIYIYKHIHVLYKKIYTQSNYVFVNSYVYTYIYTFSFLPYKAYETTVPT
jgi:hypothetical protein